MTLEELLDCSPEQLEAMTEVELETYFQPFFHVTRPEQARRKAPGASSVSNISPEMQLKLKAMAELGIDTASLKKKLNQKK